MHGNFIFGEKYGEPGSHMPQLVNMSDVSTFTYFSSKTDTF